MGGRTKCAPPVVKKVSPPTVPDTGSTGNPRHSGSSFSSGVYSAGDHRASFSSSLSDDTNPPASPRSPARGQYILFFFVKKLLTLLLLSSSF